MAVNTSVLKIFAPAVRRQLIDGIGRKLDLLINTKTPDTLTTYAKQIENLREQQDKNRDQLALKGKLIGIGFFGVTTFTSGPGNVRLGVGLLNTSPALGGFLYNSQTFFHHLG